MVHVSEDRDLHLLIPDSSEGKINEILIIFLISIFSCSIDRTIVEVSETENNTLISFQKLQSKSIFKISDKNEPGEKLSNGHALIEVDVARESAAGLDEYDSHNSCPFLAWLDGSILGIGR